MRNFKKALSVLLSALLLLAAVPVSSVFAVPGDVIMDATFDNSSDGFLFGNNPATVQDGVMVLDGTLADWANVYAYASAIQAGTDYTVSFRAKAEADQTLGFKINNGWTGYTAVQQNVNVTTQWQTFDFTVNADNVSSGAIVCIQTGTYASGGTTFYIDDVKITEKGASAPATCTNLLVNGDFESGNTSGWDNLWGGCQVSMTGGHDSANGVNVVSGEWRHFRQFVSVKANTDYELTLWAKNVKNISLLIKDGNDTANMEQKGISGTGDAWTKTTLEFNTGAQTSIIISLMGVAAEAYGTFDDISLICLDESGEPETPDEPDVPGGSDEPALDNTGLVVNGNFETGDNTGWKTYGSTKVDSAAAKTGTYGLHIKGSGDWGGLGNQQITGLEIGKVYKISLWYKALANGVNIQLCEGTSDAGAKIAYIYGTANQWTEFAVEFEATTTSVFFTLVGAGNYQATEMYMDDIAITEVVLGGEDNDPNLKMIDTLLEDIKTQGRTAMVRGTLMLDFTVSGIEFELDCAGDVYATFNASKISNIGSTGGLYFTIVVDGETLARDYCCLKSIGETKVLLAEDLPAGKHTFAIYRQSEHSAGEAGICALSFEGELLEKPADKDLYIEYIGDSISCGFGNLGNASQGDGAALWSDGTQAYTFLTSQALNADWSTVSWSGLGCKYGYSTTTMQDVYPAQRYNYDKTTAYDFAKEPDIIVLALGTNDNSIQSDATLKRAGLVEMLQLVRAKNPNAPIVWIHGMMTNGVSSMIEEIVAEFGGAEAGYYACRLTQNNAGGGSHPNLAGQQKFAEELVAFIEANGLTEDTDTPEIPEEPDEPIVPDQPVTGDDLISGGDTSRMEMGDYLGLAFKFDMQVKGMAANGYVADYTNATVTIDGTEYKLVGMGAVMSNTPAYGLSLETMVREKADDNRILDIFAEKLYEWDEDSATFVIRIINIPTNCADVDIYARPYYVIEDAAGEQITIYDTICYDSYNGNHDINDGVLEW